MIADLGILLIPSLHGNAWRLALAERAAAAGWRYVDVPVGRPPEASCGERVVFVTESPQVFDGFPLDRTVVVYWTPEDTIELVRAMDPSTSTRQQVVSRASLYFSDAERLVSAGARGMRATDLATLHPDLGVIEPAMGSVTIRPVDPDHPLNFYWKLPAKLDAEATWATDLFLFPSRSAPDGGSPEISLIGKPRVLMYGPYIHMPAGKWRATCPIIADTEGRAMRIEVHWGGSEIEGGYPVDIYESGQYNLTVEASLVEDKPVELRILAPRAALEGKLLVGRVLVKRLG
ncbi:hypothetical protein [Brevundimonas sp.]|uniref:hypothetical protein n=1 Tax=Brevundimonas sp. TaxID=1871086 RepID=UPI0035B3C43C